MPFHQEDGSMTRRFGGTGLGLTLCDRIVRQMSGGLSLLGEPGVGTTARVWVVLGPEGFQNPQPPEGFRILLQDADPVGRLVFVKLLEKEGYRVDVVATPAEADHRLSSLDYEVLITEGANLDALRATRLETVRRETGIRFIGVFPMDTPPRDARAAFWTATITKPVSSQAVQKALKLCVIGVSR
jgi:CheY-like chemotaxis protein